MPGTREVGELNNLGYEYFGEAGIKGLLCLRKRGKSKYNISVVQHQSDLWNDNNILRD
ncbi:hypothetical protein [Oligoflexus tunisiensis]|uniref:hypothetical protein n=1 Tax=Oligoflexus tunisiensis TaxID=708132 RepID=UPI00159F19D1|nr:hypothetical protein [Oligoflexus tunisiensis]